VGGGGCWVGGGAGAREWVGESLPKRWKGFRLGGENRGMSGRVSLWWGGDCPPLGGEGDHSTRGGGGGRKSILIGTPWGCSKKATPLCFWGGCFQGEMFGGRVGWGGGAMKDPLRMALFVVKQMEGTGGLWVIGRRA